MRALALRAALFAALLAAPAAAATAPAAPQPWTLDDILGVRLVSDPQLSPDGKWIAYVVQELKPDSSDYQTDVWLAAVAGGEPRRLTAAPENDDTPRWSPDGRWIAFLSDRPRPARKGDDASDEGRRQVWLIRPDGGEATVLTAAAGGASAPAWSGDGRFVAFLSRDAKSDAQKKKEKDRDDAFTPDSKLPWARLWTIDVASRKAAQLTRGDAHVTGFSIAPDGQRIAYAAQATPRLDDSPTSDLWIVPAAGGAAAPLVQREGEDSAPSFSPDGRWVAFVSQDGRAAERWSNTYVCVINAAGGRPDNLTRSFDQRVGGARGGDALCWLADGESVVFTAASRTDQRLFRAFMDAKPPEPVMKSTGVDGDPCFDAKGQVLAWTHEESTQSREVWVWELERGAPHPVTATNPQLAGKLAFAKQVVTWSAPDGRQVEGLLVSPANARPGAKAPLLVNLHGGPAGTHFASFTPGSRVYPLPLFLQSGWAVLLPNPRGSDGYGEAFRGANRRDWGGADLEDVLSGVDQLAKLGLVDDQKLAVCGWSYGGYLTEALVTRTARFKAAVAGAGIADLGAMLTCDIPDGVRSYFEKQPWEDPQVYVDHSPVYRAGEVRTPTAFVHGGADERVPTPQSYEMWTALRKRGVPTDLLVLPREPHGPREPRHQRAVMQWQWDWLVKWTLNPPAVAPARSSNGGVK